MIISKYYSDYELANIDELVSLFKIIYEELDKSLPADLVEQIRVSLTPSTDTPIADADADADADAGADADADADVDADVDVDVDTDADADAGPLLTPSATPESLYISELRAREHSGDQRSPEWLQMRHDYITASVSAACAGLMGEASRNNQLMEKASMGKYRSFIGGYYTDIGNIFEPVTNQSYNKRNSTCILSFGLIPNNKAPYTFLAASTDGVTPELINIEIKTLPGRFPDGKIKREYYHQMQHQMECLGLESTDFVEVRYESHTIPEKLVSDTVLCRGAMAELYSSKQAQYRYEYSPIYPPDDTTGVQSWVAQQDSIIASYSDAILTRWIYWVQTHYSCIRVKRDPKWICTMGPLLQEFYNQMMALRRDPSRLQAMIAEKELRRHNRMSEFSLGTCHL